MKFFIIVLSFFIHLTINAEVCSPIHDVKKNSEGDIKSFNIYFSESFDLKVTRERSPELMLDFIKLYELYNSVIDYDICVIKHNMYTKIINGKVEGYIEVSKWRFVPLGGN